MRRGRRFWPTSYRGRIALMLAAMLLVGVASQAIIRGIVNDRVRSSAERSLRDQAAAIALAVDAAREPDKRQRAFEAGRYLPDTRIVVRWPAPGGLYFNLEPLNDPDLRAEATSGEVRVRLERVSPSVGLADWLVAALFLGSLAAAAALVWAAAGSLARRLRLQAANLASSAEAVASGDLTVRADVSDDELGRAAGAFNRMTAKLAEADDRQRRFLADVAHELRTPVTAIDGFATALVDGAAASPAAQVEAVGFIREESTRLRALIDELRDLTALDLGPAPTTRVTDLAQLARDTVTRLHAGATTAGVELNGPRGVVSFSTDPRHIETILSNLVRNAIAATRSGGRVDVEVGRYGDEAVLRVLDTGVGIAPEHLGRIFDRLYRVDTSRSRDLGGSGLGLAIVKKLVEDVLHGTIDVQSTVGSGSTFTVRLPAAVDGDVTLATQD